MNKIQGQVDKKNKLYIFIYSLSYMWSMMHRHKMYNMKNKCIKIE